MRRLASLISTMRSRYNVASRLVFFNKLDRPGASFRSSLLSLLSHGFHPKPMVLTLPVASFDPADYHRAEPGLQGLIDLVKWELWKWGSDGQAVRHQLPRSDEDLQNLSILPASHPIIPHLLPARTTFLDNLSMCSEELMDKLLSSPSLYLTLESSDIMPHLRGASLRNDILPVLCGSAMKHIGTELVMDYVGALLASPLDIQHERQTNNSPVRLLAWKVSWDKRRGWMTFVRVYSGMSASELTTSYS
jgi:elongation factor G